MAKKEKIYTIEDLRMVRPLVFHEKKSRKNITVQRIEIFDIDGCEVSFAAPNNVAIFASIAKKELQQSRGLYKTIIGKNLKKGGELKLEGKELSRVYNYFEHVQMSIIAMYTAIESFANLAIPESYEVSKLNSKGVKEVWDKKSIERHWKTSEKLTEILPDVLKSESPSKLPGWSKFKELESIRNDIIHQKTAKTKEQGKEKVDSSFVRRLLDDRIFNVVESGFELISFFCEKDTYHAFFPMGFSDANLKPVELDDFSEQFTLYKSAD